MLPSRGFFKKNDCPFFEKGLCVRPHCHFRHRKKVVSENSSSLDSQEDLSSENLTEIPIVNSISSDSLPISTCTSSNNESANTQYTNSNIAVKEETSSHDSLFVKLVNHPHQRISRHIPCAYTPTPQVRSAQPKNRTISAKNNVNNSSSIDTLVKTQTFSNSYNLVNNIKSDNKFLTTQRNELSLNNLNSLESEQNNFSVNSQNNTLISKKTDYKISFFNNKILDSLSYKPQSTTNSCNSNLDENDGGISTYVPSKVITAESRYEPNCNDSTLAENYVPSKDKPKETQYVPESSRSTTNQVTYKPSDKTSRETQYQPGNNSCTTEYVPTEKSVIQSDSSLLISSPKNDLSEFEFISSEIEMMKELLKDEINKKKLSTGEEVLNTELNESNEKNSKEKKSHKDKDRSKSHHNLNVKHKSEHSKSKHSSSSSSRSSHHRSSSSSRHHSSSRSSKSHSHRSSSESHKRRSSDSHKKSKHHNSHKYSSRKSKEHSSRNKNSTEEKIKKTHSENKKTECLSEEDQDANDGSLSDKGNSSTHDEYSETESENGSKKRKIIWNDEDEHRLKLLKKAEDLFDDLEDDPDTVEKECLEIFNNYSSTVEITGIQKTNEIPITTEEYENAMLLKKRTAHSTTIMADHSVLRHKTARKLNSIKSAQEVMLDRYKTVEKAKETQAPQQTIQPAPILGLNRPSIRIAAVSNIQQMLQAKKAIQEKINQGLKINERTTIAQTVSHGVSRVAHTPATKEMVEKPTVTSGSKQVPRIKRQIYLDKLLLETNKIYPTKGESAEEALKLEEEVFRSHSGSSTGYHAAFISMLLKTRRRVAAVKGETSQINSSRQKMSHFEVLSNGKKNFSFIKTKKVDISMLSDRHIYEELLRCKLTPEELKENGFPMEGSRPGYATCAINFDLKYNDKYLYIKKLSGNRRYCVRCSKQYEVDPVTLKQYKEGPETCCYHPGKKKSGGRNCDRIYNCCNTSGEGCATHVRHVTDCNDYDNLPNCVKTLSKENDTNPGVFALDCEMVYTRLGYELARVTVVNLKKQIVYDTLVKPKYAIECYNTFYSGIEEKMMEGVTTTLKDVQAILLSMFSDKTILIGHSLDSDLRALHIIHDTVVDTAVVYKNEKYHPYKYSLKDLCAKKISKIIQDNVGGHDSAEDAIAALEIMLNYVKEEVGKYDSMESYEADRVK